MKAEIKERIEDINKGIAPKGYKTSKLGIIPEDWDVKHFEDVAVINPSKENLDENEIVSFITMSDVSDDAKLIGYQPKLYKEVSNGFTAFKDRDVLVAKITPCFENGKGALVDNLLNKTGFGSTEFHVLRPKKYGDEVYIYYHTITDRFRKIGEKNMTGTAGQKRISADFVRGFLIPYPRNDIERKKITDILSTWDKAIELKEKLIEQKKEQKKGLMQRLLTGKVRLPGFKGEWKEVRLKQILEVRNEKSEITGDLELYSLTIEEGVTPKTDRYNREYLVKDDNKQYKITYKDDIVYNPSNLRFGAIAINKIQKPVLLSPIYEVLFIKDTSKYDVSFIAQLLTSDRQIRIFSTMAEGTLIERKAVKVDAFLNTAIYIPQDIKEQKAISKIIGCYVRGIELLQQELEALKQQKKGLMQLLLTGKVRVKC